MSKTAFPSRLRSAFPLRTSLGMIPLALVSADFGGSTLMLLPLYGWLSVTVPDALPDLNETNPDPDTPDSALFWHRQLTLIGFRSGLRRSSG